VDRVSHGGAQQAVYAYGREDLDWWAGQLGRRRAGAAGDRQLTRLQPAGLRDPLSPGTGTAPPRPAIVAAAG
jgi:hypothetical protein